MKTIKTLFFTLITLLSIQMVQAQCTGALSVTGTDPTFTFTTTNPNVTSAIYSWDFGDGTYSSNPLTVSHTYTTNGSFIVYCYYADSLNMCSDVDSVYVTVTSQTGNCSANFNIAGNGPTFIFTPSNTPSSPLGYYNFVWDFGDGSAAQVTANMNSIQHTYTANGTYNVQCILYDSIFCTDTVNITLAVTNAGGSVCDAEFNTYDSNGVFYFTPTYPDTSLTYSWSFGDGTSSTAMYPQHQYNPTGSGVYQACLTISSASCSDTYCDSVYVNGNPGGCDASFTYVDTNGYFTFLPTFPTAGATYYWTLSNGLISTGSSPSFLLTGPATYTICFTITDSAGTCTDSSCQTIAVGPPSGNTSIYGVITMGNLPADSGVVFLIEYDSILGTLTAVDTTTIDSGSFYIFNNVSPGSYLIKAALSPNSVGYTSYLPTYYVGFPPSGGAFGGELLWSNAAFAYSPNQPGGFSIALVAGTNLGGPGFVSGLVSQGANKVGDPISDILIIVTDMSGNPVAYEYSDNTGSFTIDNLPYGDYVLYPEVYGKTTNSMNFTLSSSNNDVDNFRVDVNSTTVDVSIATGVQTISEFTDVTLFPNPVQNELNIDFGKIIMNETTIDLYDVTGRRISSEKTSGTNSIKINTSVLQEGIYLVKLSNNEGEQVFRFVK